MRLEPHPDGIRVTVERPSVTKAGTLSQEEYDFTLQEAESLLRGLAQAIEQARAKQAERRAYRRRALAAELEAMEG